MNSYMHLFFDLDGTLTDSSLGMGNCYRHALRELGYPAPTEDTLRRCYGPPLTTAFRLLLGSDDEQLIERGIAIYRCRYASSGLYENEPYAGASNCLQVLRDGGHRLRVVTSKAHAFAVPILEHFGLMTFFDAVHAPSLHDRTRSKTDLLREAVDAVGASSSNMVMIGDRADDIRAAKECGIRSIAAAWGFAIEDELRLADPDMTVGSMDELVQRLAALLETRTL